VGIARLTEVKYNSNKYRNQTSACKCGDETKDDPLLSDETEELLVWG
jgi:hypothetical protein